MERPRSWLSAIGGIQTLIMDAVLIVLLIGLVHHDGFGMNVVFLTAFIVPLLLTGLRTASHLLSMTGSLVTLLELLWWVSLVWALIWAINFIINWNNVA